MHVSDVEGAQSCTYMYMLVCMSCMCTRRCTRYSGTLHIGDMEIKIEKNSLSSFSFLVTLYSMAHGTAVCVRHTCSLQYVCTQLPPPPSFCPNSTACAHLSRASLYELILTRDSQPHTLNSQHSRLLFKMQPNDACSCWAIRFSFQQHCILLIFVLN